MFVMKPLLIKIENSKMYISKSQAWTVIINNKKKIRYIYCNWLVVDVYTR